MIRTIGFRTGLLVLLVGLAVPGADAQAPLQMVVTADQGKTTISRHIYGHFSEHLGRMIYDGVWTKAGTGQWHFRDDVIEALRRIKVPNLRWPGGCFADYYFWKDGIGPRDQRPTIVNTVWGGVTEDNSFGTHEFLELTTRLGADPVIVGNVGSGTVRDMAQWWEYVNHPGGSPMSDLRRKNGRAEPWNVRYWGVGNENWGCGGNMTPEYYANEYKRFITFLRPYGDVRPFRIAAGPSTAAYEWTEVLMREAARRIDGLDLHYYTRSSAPAVEFAEPGWFETIQRARRMDELVTRHAAIMDKYDAEKRVSLIVGEWGTWHRVEPGTNPGFLYQQSTLRDAMVASVTLDILNRHADRVRMANIAQMVNVLQSVILTEGEKMLLTPTYHVFEFYTVHHDALLLPMTLEAGQYEHGGQSIPAVSATASRPKDGPIHITMTNVDPNRPRTVRATIDGATVSQVSGRILTAAQMTAHNTFERPNALQPAPFTGARVSGGTLTVDLPAKSIVVLELR